MNVVELCQHLLRFPSITPHSVGSIEFIESLLTDFTIQRYVHFDPKQQADVVTLFAVRGSPRFCFVGHLDVVPPGPEDKWKYPPFSGVIQEGSVWGRGAVDMKGAIAAMLSVALSCKNDIAFLLTTDEEGPSTHGIKLVAEELKGVELFVVGEPTSEDYVGDTIKVGRRGSMNFSVVAKGIQGHVAYPYKSKNPIPILLDTLRDLTESPLDSGTDFFEASHIEITSIDVGNSTRNIIPESATALLNCRFNPTFTSETLVLELDRRINNRCELSINNASFAFLGLPEADIYIEIIEQAVGKSVNTSTSGGTSDARFLYTIAPVFEIGLLNSLAHKIDERVSLSDLYALESIYSALLKQSDSFLSKS